ncbi:hypothetical protein [Curtobacterium poinsettiae]|uniref:hypothetical protein n=1 Tax=Curtobacterium poinsettiae TaxID=159612 RepID=UPI0021C88399|nr:hypothetical protein [Curtobacterium flaccumfaciens]MCU0115192.1 hypothetical protein [Curtobacterium flaccumfaciens]
MTQTPRRATHVSSTYRHPEVIRRSLLTTGVPAPRTANYLGTMTLDRFSLARTLMAAVEQGAHPRAIIEPYQVRTWEAAPIHRRKEWTARVVANADPALLARLRGTAGSLGPAR